MSWQTGDWVRMIDGAAFPGITGQVLRTEGVHHVVTGELVATYCEVEWQGRGPKPDAWQKRESLAAARDREVEVHLW